MQNALINLAGAVRFELTTKVLETHVMTLYFVVTTRLYVQHLVWART